MKEELRQPQHKLWPLLCPWQWQVCSQRPVLWQYGSMQIDLVQRIFQRKQVSACGVTAPDSAPSYGFMAPIAALL
jgi:hypothetical protein